MSPQLEHAPQHNQTEQSGLDFRSDAQVRDDIIKKQYKNLDPREEALAEQDRLEDMDNNNPHPKSK